MKVYVDELPKDDCPCNRDGRCRLLQKECYVCYFEMEKNEHCPLKSLADYTKQVRKEVCEEFKQLFAEKSTFTIGGCYEEWQMQISKEVFEQIIKKLKG